MHIIIMKYLLNIVSKFITFFKNKTHQYYFLQILLYSSIKLFKVYRFLVYKISLPDE